MPEHSVVQACTYVLSRRGSPAILRKAERGISGGWGDGYVESDSFG